MKLVKAKSTIVKKFSEWIAKKIKTKRLPLFVKFAISSIKIPVIQFVINKLLDKVPNERIGKVLNVFQCVYTKNYKKLSKRVLNEASDAIKTPISNRQEKIILHGVVDIVFKLIEDDSKPIDRP